jgi:hypothetical protein
MGIVLGEVETLGKLPDIRDLEGKIPIFIKRLLGMVGYSSAMQLFNENFKGQKLKYDDRYGLTTKGRSRAAKMPATRTGRPLVNYTVSSRNKEVSIHSFPENLFEKGRTLRSGTPQAGLWVMRSAKPTLAVSAYAASALETILNDTSKNNPFKELK